MKKVNLLVVAATLMILAATATSAQASDHCRRNTTRNYGYGPQPAYFTEYMQNRYVPRQSYYTDYIRQRNCGSSYSAPTTTVCSPVVRYSYQPGTRVYYVRRPMQPIVSIRIVID